MKGMAVSGDGSISASMRLEERGEGRHGHGADVSQRRGRLGSREYPARREWMGVGFGR